MIYNYAEAGDGKFLVTGQEGTSLYGLNGFTEAQAVDIAFHLNVAFESGEAACQAKIKDALGFMSRESV